MAERFSVRSAVGWSLTWGVGVAIGVALGAYLTVLGATAAPGDVSLDRTELLVLPVVAGTVVFIASFAGRALIALFRGGSASKHGSGPGDEEEQHQNEGVTAI